MSVATTLMMEPLSGAEAFSAASMMRPAGRPAMVRSLSEPWLLCTSTPMV